MISCHIIISQWQQCFCREIITAPNILSQSNETHLGLTSSISDGSSTLHSQFDPKPFVQREEFWRKNWSKHHREPLQFIGIPQSGERYQITSLMKMLVEIEDYFFRLISGHFPTPKSLHSIVHPIRLKKIVSVFWNTFFQGSPLKEFDCHPHFDKWKHALMVFRLTWKQKKLYLFLTKCFRWNTLNFVSMNMENYVVDKVEILSSIITFQQRKMVKMEVRFTSEYPVISDFTVKVIGRDFQWLLATDRLSQMRFRELQQNRGLLLMMNMALQFANAGGRCAVDQPPSSANYRQAIFWYVINIFRHASYSLASHDPSLSFDVVYGRLVTSR